VDLDARAYRGFVAVADERSFTRAAARLNLSQPALSGQVRELERRLGFALFTRSSRRVELTSEGRLFLPNARRFINEADIIGRAARDIRANELRLGAALHTELVPERRRLVEAFMREHGETPMQILNDPPARLLRDLSARVIDLAISIEPLPTGEAWRPGDVRLREDGDGTVLEHLLLSARPIELLFPCEQWPAPGDVPASALRGLPVAVPNRFHGVPLTEAINYRLTELGAELVRPPEGHARAVERYGRLKRIAAVALGWFDGADPGETDGAAACVRRAVSGLGLATALTLIRQPGDHRPAAQSFWRFAERLAGDGGLEAGGVG
jgi:DNA-binding transcriptional LysR family regulator